ncbi:MAG: ribonuclease Z [Clostridia bacterium]|nr:ribonuclease Z [Clostridia bacterium]
MIDAVLLGCGGSIPLKERWLTSCLVRCNGKCILIDCGEGTQIALKSAGYTFKPIDAILFTHFHADHISGLPGFLLSMGNAGREEPLELIGPKGLSRTVNALRVIAPELPFEVKCTEISGNNETFHIDEFEINAYKMIHSVTCYGYRIDVHRAGKFDRERALDLGLPQKMWGILQKGENVEYEGKAYSPCDVLGAPRKGISIAYCTDTRPVENIVTMADRVDLFICEGMYGEDEKQQKAADKFHMTFREAAELAKRAEVKKLWLTHFSPSLVEPEAYIGNAKELFCDVCCGYDGMSTVLTFEE